MKFQLAEARQVAAEEAHRIAREEARRAAEEEARLRDQRTRILEELAGDEGKARVFVMVRKIVSEELGVDENKVHLESHLSNDLSADELDLVELVMALEEEFDIEIPDSEAEDQLGIFYSSGYSSGSFWSTLSSMSGYPSSYSSSGGAGKNCIVKNFVDYICNKVSA